MKIFLKTAIFSYTLAIIVFYIFQILSYIVLGVIPSHSFPEPIGSIWAVITYFLISIVFCVFYINISDRFNNPRRHSLFLYPFFVILFQLIFYVAAYLMSHISKESSITFFTIDSLIFFCIEFLIFIPLLYLTSPHNS